MTPEEYIVRDIYRNASSVLGNIIFTDEQALASIMVLGIRMGIALHYRRPEAAEVILQALRKGTNTLTYNANYDTDTQMIEIIIGKDIWQQQTPIPTVN